MVKTGDNDAAAYPAAGVDQWKKCLAEPVNNAGTVVKQYFLF